MSESPYRLAREAWQPMRASLAALSPEERMDAIQGLIIVVEGLFDSIDVLEQGIRVRDHAIDELVRMARESSARSQLMRFGSTGATTH